MSMEMVYWILGYVACIIVAISIYEKDAENAGHEMEPFQTFWAGWFSPIIVPIRICVMVGHIIAKI